ncbi:MAG: anhydro-N-acetylmuramic acid kinase [Marinobacter sp.]|nr:anhydro-N-acetylmuramic acid kinase [Marinobacter sp.]
MNNPLYVGLMSGTSMDAIDAVLVSFQNGLHLLATHSTTYPPGLREHLSRLAQNQGTPDDLGQADNLLGEAFAHAVKQLLTENRIDPSQVRAIGSHGQTVRHRSEGEARFSLQLGDPNIIAERTGITTVADFRRRDMAAGGEGAPLVPAFHQAFLASPEENRCIINIGGIANITWLPRDGKALGFDTGPGNALMDAWCMKHTGRHFDEDGHWAADGIVNQALLSDMLTDAYFRAPAPKSTGKERFNLEWIETCLRRHGDVSPTDVQRTLLELTALTIMRQLPEPSPARLYICGGGARNKVLMQQLARVCEPATVETTDKIGLDPQWVEAVAFAWLAARTLDHLAGNLPAVTGAAGPRVLGGVYAR